MAVPILWRTKKQRYSLQGQVCPECSQSVFPPRKVCPYCSRPTDALYAHDQEKATRYSFLFMLPHALEIRAAGDD